MVSCNLGRGRGLVKRTYEISKQIHSLGLPAYATDADVIYFVPNHREFQRHRGSPNIRAELRSYLYRIQAHGLRIALHQAGT